MLKREVVIGGRYRAKVSNKLTVVEIIAESRFGGWDAKNVTTNRSIRIRSAGKLRSVVSTPEKLPEPKGDTAKKYLAATRQALEANGQSTERPTKARSRSNANRVGDSRAMVNSILKGEVDGYSVREALNDAITFLGDFVYNGAESGQTEEIDKCILRLSDFLHQGK